MVTQSLKIVHATAYEGFLQFLHQLLKMALFSQIFFCVCVQKNHFILLFDKLEFYEVEKF